MFNKLALAAAFLIVSRSVFADPVTFSVAGDGGLSQPVAPLGSESVWWADIAGNVSADSFASSGFALLPGFTDTGLVHQGLGSFMVSSPMTIADGESLSVSLSLLSGMHYEFSRETVGFVALLENGQTDAVLAAMSPFGSTTWTADEYYSTLGQRRFSFATLSDGVQLTQTFQSESAPVSLGGRLYSADAGTALFDCPGCRLDLKSDYVPGAGTYQLLAGIYNLKFPAASDPSSHVAIAVTNVSVPEPGLLALVGLGLATAASHGIRRVRRRS